MWSTNYQQVAAHPQEAGHNPAYPQDHQALLPPTHGAPAQASHPGLSHNPAHGKTQGPIERRSFTDIPCAIIFAASMAFSVWIAIYAFRNGDPRKVYHGMNYQGQICGVDLPYQPYVYWCAAEGGGLSGWNLIPVTRLDFEHPICLEFCPTSPLTESPCFDPATGATRPVADYATHPVAKRYCLPQAQAMLDKVQDKLGSHPIEKYIPIVITCIRSGWPVLLGAFFLAIILSYLYLLLIDCGAGMLIWSCMFFSCGRTCR